MNNSVNNRKILTLKSIAKKALDEKVIEKDIYDDLISRIQKNEFRITIVGEFSSGKSTLLDAIIGRDILPHSTSETTATLTYIHSVAQGDSLENIARIEFVNGEIRNVTFDELKDYATTFSKTIDVFSQIDHIDIYTHIENFDSNIVLIDTPGLNGTNHLEDKTLMEISKADASVFVFSPSGIKNTEMSFMKEELKKYQSSFFYVMNRIDDLKESEGDTLESKISTLKGQISELFFDNAIVPKNVIGVSALKALVAKDLSIKRLYLDDIHEISDDDRAKLWEASNFQNFLNMLKTYLSEEKESVFVNSLLSHILFALDEKLIEINQGIEANAPKSELPEATIIKDEINTSKYRFDNYNKTLSKNINAKMDDAEKYLQGLLSNAVTEGQKKLEEEKKHIDSINSIEDFDNTFGADGSKASVIVNSFYDRIYEQINLNVVNKMNDIEDDLVIEIKNMIPSISSLEKRDATTVSIGQKSYQGIAPMDTSHNSDIINEIQEDIQRIYSKINVKQQEKDVIDQKANNLRDQQSSITYKMDNVDRQIRNLGYRPSSRWITVTRTRTRSVKDNGFTNLWGLFGNRYKKVTEEYTDIEEDTTERDNYDYKRQTLDRERNELNNQLQNIRNQIQTLPDLANELRQLQREYERKKEEIEYQQKEIERSRIEYNQKKRQGEQAFLNSRKMDLLKVLTDVLSFSQSPLHSSLKVDTFKYLENCRNNLENVIRSYFKQESEKYIAQLETMLNTLESTTVNLEVAKKRDSLCASKKVIEKFVEEIKSLI